MPGTRSKRWTLVASALALLTSGVAAPRASAQTPEVAAPATTMTPPRVTKFVEAKRPDTTPAEGAAVDLELTIAADGKLTDAKVVGSAGDALDAAALEAVKQFTFEPARKGDRAIPARIRYRYTFDPTPVPAPAAPDAAAGADAAPLPAVGQSGAPPRPPRRSRPGRQGWRADPRRHHHAAVGARRCRNDAGRRGRRVRVRRRRARALQRAHRGGRLLHRRDARDGDRQRGHVDHLPPRTRATERHPVRVRRHRQHRRAAPRGGEANARARRAGEHRRHARRSAARDRALAGRRPPARPRGLPDHPRRVAVRFAGVLRGRHRRPHLPLRRAHQLRQPAPPRPHRPLPRELLGALRPKDGRHHRRRHPRSQGRRAARDGRRQPDRRVLHRRGAGRQARVVRPRRQAQLHRFLVQQRRPPGRHRRHRRARVLRLPGRLHVPPRGRREGPDDVPRLGRRVPPEPEATRRRRSDAAGHLRRRDVVPPPADDLAADAGRARRAGHHRRRRDDRAGSRGGRSAGLPLQRLRPVPARRVARPAGLARQAGRRLRRLRPAGRRRLRRAHRAIDRRQPAVLLRARSPACPRRRSRAGSRPTVRPATWRR